MLENINLAIAGIVSNKMRALLTMLGIIIGIGSVIAITTVGNALISSIYGEMSAVGASNIQVFIADRASDYDDSSSGIASKKLIPESDLITDIMIDAYKKNYSDEIETINIYKNLGAGRIEDGRNYANVTVFPCNDGMEKANNVTLLDGRFINKDDLLSNRNVAVVSDKLINNMFKSVENPLGREINLTIGDKIQSFRVIGIYKYIENNFELKPPAEKDIVSRLYVPLPQYKNLSNNTNDGYSNFVVMAKPEYKIKKVSQNAKTFFNRYYKTNSLYRIDTLEMEDMIQTVSTLLNTISVAIAVIAGISLVVGGIGVMNIMLVSVTERTREIGTRKALGARSKDIMTQFIVESVIICVIGGFIGIIIGCFGGIIAAKIIGYDAQVSVLSIIISVAFSSGIGVFFGYYPAKKAASLNPIEALRYE